jgi:hypothetical protein
VCVTAGEDVQNGRTQRKAYLCCSQQRRPSRRCCCAPLPVGAPVRWGMPVAVTGGSVLIWLIETHHVRAPPAQEVVSGRVALPPQHRHEELPRRGGQIGPERLRVQLGLDPP